MVLAVGERGRAEECRIGLQPGDLFSFAYGCPGGFCSKSMLQVFSLCEAVRSGGDLRNLGGTERTAVEFCCPDGVVWFRLRGERES